MLILDIASKQLELFASRDLPHVQGVLKNADMQFVLQTLYQVHSKKQLFEALIFRLQLEEFKALGRFLEAGFWLALLLVNLPGMMGKDARLEAEEMQVRGLLLNLQIHVDFFLFDMLCNQVKYYFEVRSVLFRRKAVRYESCPSFLAKKYRYIVEETP